MTAQDDTWAKAREIAAIVIRQFEGDRLESYVLKGETWATISVGVAIPLNEHPKTITQAESGNLFAQELTIKIAQLQKEIPMSVLLRLLPEQRAAVISFRYNMKDSVWLSPDCKTRQALASGNMKIFWAMQSLWINGSAGPLPGLRRRRRVERELGLGTTLETIEKANWYQGQY